MGFLTFGDIIKIDGGTKNGEYVYLAQTLDIVYLAKILNNSQSKAVTKWSCKPNATTEKTLFSFIVLTTESFQNRVAHLGKPGNDTSIFEERVKEVSELNESDKKELKDEIFRKNSFAPQQLREQIELTEPS